VKRQDNLAKALRKFVDLLDKLLRVPHSELKAKLDAEKEAKKRKKSKKSSASGREAT
jgi:hypothetical protein